MDRVCSCLFRCFLWFVVVVSNLSHRSARFLFGLLSAMDGEVISLVEWGDKMDHFYTLDMLVTTETAISGQPCLC